MAYQKHLPVATIIILQIYELFLFTPIKTAFIIATHNKINRFA